VSLTWILIRGSGIAAFAMLAGAVIWGLMISSKVFGRAVKAKGLQWIHESIGLAAVLATVIHLIALVADEFIDFTWVEVLVPGASDWEPLAVALGVVAFWTSVVVSFSFYIKKWIGQNAWRTIHFLSYGALLAALIHGVMAGTDTTNPLVASMYIGVLVVVVLMTAIRFAAAMGPAARTATARSPEPAAAQAEAATTEPANEPRTVTAAERAKALAARSAAARAAATGQRASNGAGSTKVGSAEVSAEA